MMKMKISTILIQISTTKNNLFKKINMIMTFKTNIKMKKSEKMITKIMMLKKRAVIMIRIFLLRTCLIKISCNKLYKSEKD